MEEDCRRLVDLRDRGICQFTRCLTAVEFNQLKVGSPGNVDRCHIFPRSSYPELINNSNNIITLRRFIHRRLDDWLCPLTGNVIDLRYHYFWWYRIFLRKIENFNSEFDYELELLEKIRRTN